MKIFDIIQASTSIIAIIISVIVSIPGDANSTTKSIYTTGIEQLLHHL